MNRNPSTLNVNSTKKSVQNVSFVLGRSNINFANNTKALTASVADQK